MHGAVAHTDLASEEPVSLADILISRAYKSMELLQGPHTHHIHVRELADPYRRSGLRVLRSGFLLVSFLGDRHDLWQPGLSLALSLSCDPVPKAE